METTRTTVYLEADLHRALRLRSASSDHSLSRIVNEAVRRALAEDAADLEALHGRKNEKSLEFGTFVRGLKRGGRL
jgi:hypothetical protein